MKNGDNGKVLLIFIVICVIFFLFVKEEQGNDTTENGIEYENSEKKDYSYKAENNKTNSSKEVEIDNSVENIVSDKEDFILSCNEININDISEKTVGMYIKKDLFGWHKQSEDSIVDYECAAVEDFIEDLNFYQRTYNVYRIIDDRFDKSFPFETHDVIRIYGIVDSVSQNYESGKYTPTIKVYYIEYIRQYGEPEGTKTEEEIKEERILAQQELDKENAIKDSMNSDYNGATKNVENMFSLNLEEYISKCDEMNLKNLHESEEDLTGRHVKIHIQTDDHKIFKDESGKETRLGEWTDIKNVQDDVWTFKLYNERVEEYMYSGPSTLYFMNAEDIKPKNLKKEQNLIVYGQIVKYSLSNYGDIEVLVRYYEFE